MAATEIRILCVKLGISVAELARRCHTSPQAFNQKLQRDSFTPAELNQIAGVVGCEYESAFILPTGDRIQERFLKWAGEAPEGRRFRLKPMTDSDIERRCRYRLGKHGLRLHKITDGEEPLYYIYEEGGDDSRPDDVGGYLTLNRLVDYCEQLAEKEADYGR